MNKEHQQAEFKAFAWSILFFLGCLVVLAFFLSGCAQTLDKSISTCFVHAGKPAYTVDGTFTRFECK